MRVLLQDTYQICKSAYVTALQLGPRYADPEFDNAIDFKNMNTDPLLNSLSQDENDLLDTSFSTTMT